MGSASLVLSSQSFPPLAQTVVQFIFFPRSQWLDIAEIFNALLSDLNDFDQV
jgi:hypothetical protein